MTKNMFENYERNIEVKLERNYLLKNLYWTVNKFRVDPDHKQQNSSREDLIGGFFDRWINRIPEYLIFNELLPDDFFPVIDNFIYTDKTSKNAPDIIGLKHISGKYFPFAKFNNNRWELLPNAPFIEMKVFRKDQNLITIPSSQFDFDKYYAIVESYVPDDYLISIFCDDFFNEENFDFIQNSEIKKNFVNGDNGLYEPVLIKKPQMIGGFKLLGIYKGEELYKFGKCTKMNNNEEDSGENKVISPIYLKENPTQEVFSDLDILKIGKFNEYYYNTKSIPIIIKILSDSEIAIVNSSEFCLSIRVEGIVLINNEEIGSGQHNLIFDLIYRNGIRYYYLKYIDKYKQEIIFEKDMKLFSGMLFHDGSKQTMVDFSFKVENMKYLNLVLITDKYLTFKSEGGPEINNKVLKNGYNKFNIIAHKNEKSNNDVFYRQLVYESNNSKFNNHTRKYSRLFLSIPDGFNDFDNEIIKNPLLDLSGINFEILNETATIIKKNQLNNFIIAVNGSINLNGEKYDKNLYKIMIGKQGNSYFIDSIRCEDEEDFKHPLFNDNHVDIVDYAINNIGENEFIIDLNLLNTLKNSNSNANEDSENVDEENNDVGPLFIPISLKLDDKKSIINVHEKNQSKMIISINGSAKIDGVPIDDKNNNLVSKNFWKLDFDRFERSSKKDEFILSKRSLFIAESSELDLLRVFKEYISNFNNNL